MPESVPDTARVMEVAAPPCAADDLGEEIVVLNVETGVYFSIRGLGATVWRSLATGIPAEALSAMAEGADRAAAVRAFIEQLTSYGIMRASTRLASDVTPAIVAEMQATDEIIFEAYDDIQDLLLSDPIHDVDPVQGWPKPRR